MPVARSIDVSASKNSPASPPGVPITPCSSRPSTHDVFPCSSSAAIFTQRTLCGSPMWASIWARVSGPDGLFEGTGARGVASSRVSTASSRTVEKPSFFHAKSPPSITATKRSPAHSSTRAASAARAPPLRDSTITGVVAVSRSGRSAIRVIGTQ